MDEVVAEYQLTWDEYRRMQWVAARRRNIVLVVVVLILALIVAVAGDDLQWRIAAGIFAIGLPLMVFWIAPRNYWNNGLGIRESRRVTLDDHGMVSKSESVEFKLDWTQVARVQETSDYFVLLAKNRRVLLVILKRGLLSKDDGERLRLLLRDRVTVTP